jgi:hypothetical protein
MKYLSPFLSGAIPALVFWFAPGWCLLAEEPAPAARPLFGWNFLWAGSWEEGKTLHNRGDLRLLFPVPGLGLRAELIDRRPLDPGSPSLWEDMGEGITNYGGGLYHGPTGSRLLYGILDEWGLSARIRSPWIRALPLPENHKPAMADLKTSVSVTGEPEAYLYLGSPGLKLFGQSPGGGIELRGFASVQVDQEIRPGFGGGLEARFGGKTEVRLDGFYTGKTLPPRKSSSWFSLSPPLPEREFRIGALGLLLHMPVLSLSSDWAFSETFAWGRDLYGNLGLRFAPALPASWGRWSLSLAADGAGSRYVGRDGSSPGAGFRSGGRLEWRGKRSSLLRFNTSLRSPGLGEGFNRSSSSLSWRFPSPGGNKPQAFRFTRISLGADRNASDTDKILDGLDLSLGFSLNPRGIPGSDSAPNWARGLLGSPVSLSFTGSLKGVAAAEGGRPSPYPVPQSPQRIDSARAAGELSWSPGIFSFKTKLGYGVQNEKEGLWETSAAMTVRFKPGRFSVKISSPDFLGEWAFTAAWRVEKK